MPIAAYNLITSLLALAAAGLGLVMLLATSRRNIPAWCCRLAPWMALAITVCATAGSLIYSGYFHFEPCRLCWYQRIAMYPLTLLLLVGLLRGDRGVRWYVLPPAGLGFSVSVYHYLLQSFPNLSGDTACSITAPCNAKFVNEFGFISIPFMAGCGFLAVIGLMAAMSREEAT
jgi:disulfide bond formation protein DsbB